jgi:glycosyltransferase involved in cell wall biosynthesis
LLEALRVQTYPLHDLEVIVADGMSADGTRSILEDFGRRHSVPPLLIVDNPARTIPAGLNRALGAASGRIIVRLDAHSLPRPDYVAACVEALGRTGAANVGGAWDIRPGTDTAIARAIAAAAAHPLGAGDARYRTGGGEGAVDTVPFGAFARTWLERVGPYDESLLTNEDYELNVRLRRAGGVVWFSPRIQAVYFARPDLGSLARQYRRYGYWKGRMLRRDPVSLRWRQAIPPSLVATLLLTAAAAVWMPPAARLLGLESVGYAGLLVAAGVTAAIRRRDVALLFGLPAALATMHLSWGGSFWAGLLDPRT